MTSESTAALEIAPILLYDGGCATCRRSAHWVHLLAAGTAGHPSIVDTPVGDDPEALRKLNPKLDIWNAYAVVHVVMPDGTMRLGGEAVAEVLRRLPKTRWFARCFSIRVFGKRPFQMALNLAYTVLYDVRPLLGCTSCGRPRLWVRPIKQLAVWSRSLNGHTVPASRKARSASLSYAVSAAKLSDGGALLTSATAARDRQADQV